MAGDVLSKAQEIPAEQNWWDWVTPDRGYSTIGDDASDSTKEEFFNNLVKRCVLVQPLSPTETTTILVEAIEQFEKVCAVKILKSPLQVRVMAVVDMETPSRADAVVGITQEFMFMIGGMPRPARAQLAKPVMFMNHPCKPKTPFEVEQFQIPTEHMKVWSQALEGSASERKKVKECLEGADYLLERQEKEEQELHASQEETYQALSTRFYQRTENLKDPNLKAVREKYANEERRMQRLNKCRVVP